MSDNIIKILIWSIPIYLSFVILIYGRGLGLQVSTIISRINLFFTLILSFYYFLIQLTLPLLAFSYRWKNSINYFLMRLDIEVHFETFRTNVFLNFNGGISFSNFYFEMQVPTLPFLLIIWNFFLIFLIFLMHDKKPF